MKHPKLKLKVRKKVRISGIKRLRNLIREDVHYSLLDIEPYIVNDIMRRLKKEGIIYVKKNKKKNSSKKKK